MSIRTSQQSSQLFEIPSYSGECKGKVVLFFPTPGIEQNVWFPFPYLYLGPFLERAGYSVVVIDARVDREWEATLERQVDDCVAFGVTSMSGPDLGSALRATEIARDANGAVPILWGGHHVSALPDQVLLEGVADVVLMGPSEFTLPKVIDAIAMGDEMPDLPGVVWMAKNGQISGNRTVSPAVFDYDIDPGYHLLDVEKYRSENNVTAYFKTRGCPFKCTFCATGNFDTSTRTQQQYESELLHLINKLGFKNLVFRDPTFFLGKKTVLDCARIMKDLGPEVNWKGQARATFHKQYSRDDLKFMRDSGLKSVMFGIETGSERMMSTMEKRTKVQDAIKSAEVCADLDIEMYASFMFAMPGETVDDLKETIKLMREIKKIHPKALLQNCIFLPLPNTRMYADALERGYVPPTTTEGWSTRNISSRFEERDDISWMTPQELHEYSAIYTDEFGRYRHAYEREKDGSYDSPLNKGGNTTEMFPASATGFKEANPYNIETSL
jgi:anaerobic magnesium-protoporphyrin IX monomethyl ester cyclase